MKNIKHYVIIGVEIILLGVIGVNASTSVPSHGVSYTNTSSKESVSTVESALNELYKGFKVGNATAAQILTGKTALVQGQTITGSMANRGAVTKALNAGESYTIPAGYHNGSGKVTANSLASQTSATATAANIQSGKTAWVNGSKITGTLTLKKTLVWSGTIDPGDLTTVKLEYINLNNYYSNYKNITSNNIGIEQTDLATTASGFGGCSTSWTYTPSSGLITLTLTARKNFPNCGKQSYNVYVYTIG